MSAGRLRHQLRFERRAFEDATGARTGDWEPAIATPIRAGVKSRLGGEVAVEQRLQGRQPYAVDVRLFPGNPGTADISTSWRAVDTRTGEVHDIQAVAFERVTRWVNLLTVVDCNA